MEAQAAIPRAKADAEVGKERGSQLGAAGRASFQAATPRNPFVLLTWKAVHSRWGGGPRGRLDTPRSLSGAVGQVGAVLSAPVSQPPPQMPRKPPHPKACRVAPLGPCVRGPQDPATE